MDAGDQIKALQAEVEKWKQLAQDLHHREQRKWTRSPAFSTYIELKEGPAGRVLAALQDGLISRNKAAEALAEIAHGATEVSMPEPSDIFGLDEIPAETVVKLRAQIRTPHGYWFDTTGKQVSVTEASPRPAPDAVPQPSPAAPPADPAR